MNLIQSSPSTITFYKAKSHSGINGNEGADHLAHKAAVVQNSDISLPQANVDKLAFCVRSLIVQAASSRAVGMSAQARCVFKRERSRKGPLIPVWFHRECWEKCKKFIEAVKTW